MSDHTIQTLQDAGMHFGYPRTRRHPSAAPFLFGTKDRTDLFDLSQTVTRLEAAKEFVGALAGSGKQILFVGGKNEAIVPIRDAAMSLGVPFVAGRWIGGTLTNFKNIRRRVERLEQITADKESGELGKKYTKREQLMLSREADNLEFRFGGIVSMKDLPGALFIVDPRHEDTAVKEANQLRIPIIALSSSDGDFNKIQFPIPANDTVQKSIRLVVSAIADAFASGRRTTAPTERAVEVK